MDQSDKLENCKKEIRSILIPYQRGCLLSEFNRAYLELIGRRLPIREFGFHADIEFLYAMPDVVKITPTRSGEYHLTGVADEKSKHIQKMVARQKPAKSKPSTRFSKPSKSNYVFSPFFTESLSRHEPTSREVRQFSEPKLQSNVPKLLPKAQLTLPPKVVSKEPKSVSKISIRVEPKLPPKASPREEVLALVQYYDNQIALGDLLYEYKQMYQKDLLLEKYGFSSLEECIECIPELYLENINKYNTLVKYHPISPDASNIDVNNGVEDARKNHQYYAENAANGSSEVSVAFQSKYNNNNQNDGRAFVPDSLRKKLLMVAERFTEGIRSSEFPSCFEEVTGAYLDLYSLGYRCLNDFIDDVRDIFTLEPVPGSKKDFIIYSVKKSRSELNGTKIVIHHVIVNLRRILQAYPEGIQLQDFPDIYSINCNDTLCIKDFGFDDLETFLSSIKNQVPLQINSSKGIKTVHMFRQTDIPECIKAPETSQKEVIPFDAAYPDFKFEHQTLPDDFDFSKYIPVYTSSVAHPGHLYVQLQGEETTGALIKLAENIETFYCGSKSVLYTMKNIHIKVGASCVAKWPFDNHWYRAEIISIPCMETVQVHYLDYGTRDTISKTLLRYIKKEFCHLPAQALKCHLAYLKPPKNTTKWNVQTRNRILELCEDVPLMAKIEKIELNGVYSILLCDTNGEEDVYINDVLCNEELADYDVVNGSSDSIAAPKPVVLPEYRLSLNPLQALQAQYYLQAFVTVAPCFAQNENYKNLLKEVTMYCPNPDQGKQNVNIPSSTAFVPPGFNAVLSNVPTLGNSDMLTSAYSTPLPISDSRSEMKSRVNDINPPVHVPSSTNSEMFKSVELSAQENGVADCDIFDDDDDDEIFEEFCEKISLSSTRHVKRVLLGEGYKIHIIVVASKPYTSSGDISHLIWSNKEADYLSRRLQLKDVDIPSLSLSEVENEELFQQLEQFSVKGIQRMTGCKASILLYPLRLVIRILNIFGHPSVTLRTKLTEEIANFNPNDPDWMNFSSAEPLESEEEENISGVTDDDKIEKLCLFDLLAMKESVTLRRKKFISLNSSRNDVKSDEMDKLEQLHQKVLQRIQEIKEICIEFS